MILALTLALTMAADAPRLFYLEPTKGACKAQLRDLASGAVTTAFATGECPKHVLWSAAKKKAVYVEKGHVWIRAIDDAKAKPADLGALPATGVERVFIVEGSRNIRATSLVMVPEQDVVTKGDKTTYTYAGKKIDATGQPPFGAPFVAILWELDAKGAWKQVDVSATKWEASDTLGAAVLDTSNIAKDVVEVAALLRGATCVGGPLECDTEHKGATKLVGKKDDSMVGVLRDEKKSALLAFAVMFGDTPHAVPPVFVCAKDCATGTKLAVTGTQLGITRAGGWLLIAEEYSGNDPVVFDAAGKEIARMKGAQSAVFLP